MLKKVSPMNQGVVRSVERHVSKVMVVLIDGIVTVHSVKCMLLLALSVVSRLKFRSGQVVTVRFTAETALASRIIRATNEENGSIMISGGEA